METLVKHIPLQKGKFTIVDVDDYEWLVKHKWYFRKDYYTFYASRTIYPGGRKGKHYTVQMHREILGLVPGDGIMVDHINRNGLDNRKENLRIAEGSINQYNCKIRKDNSSGYRGIVWSRYWQRWQARISIKGIRVFCGWHPDPISAAMAYDKAAILYRGNNAILNFPERKGGYNV